MIQVLPPAKVKTKARSSTKGRNVLLPLVEERLSKAIAATGLTLMDGKHPRQVWLVHAACRLVLTWHADNEVVCSVVNRGASLPGGSAFEMQVFLYVSLGDRAARFLPQYLDCGCGDRRSACLDAVGTALLAGALDAPLKGDFGWVREYHRLVEEAFEVGERLVGYMTRYRPELEELAAKWRQGDLSWIGDAKGLLSRL